MEINNPEEMARFATDVRQQEEPYIATATSIFQSLFAAEYRRLRASALESGESTAVLNVAIRCNFDPATRSIDMQTAPAPMTPKPRRKAAAVAPRAGAS